MKQLQKLLLFLSLVIAFLNLSAQEINDYTSLTDSHVQIEGTAVYLIPPQNFEASSRMKGFTNPSDPTSMIMLMEIPGPIEKFSSEFTPEKFEAQGMKVLSINKVLVQEDQGFELEVEQDANGYSFSKYILVYGDEQTSIMINGTHLKDSAELGKQIRESIKSIVVNKDLKVDPLSALSFTIEPEAGGLQVFRVMGNAVILNRDGKAPTESEDKLSVIVDKSFQKTEIPNPKAFCIKRLKNYPDDYELDLDYGIQEVELDGISGYGLKANNRDDETEKAYQLLLFDEEVGYFLIFATYLASEEKAWEDAQKVIQTFKRKP
ncbi:MAG: hypothetical protein AAGD28_10665 [Bacteroidota bacterium]